MRGGPSASLNDTTEARENVTNEPKDSWEDVTSEPKLTGSLVEASTIQPVVGNAGANSDEPRSKRSPPCIDDL
jgi:hypothetical protein